MAKQGKKATKAAKPAPADAAIAAAPQAVLSKYQGFHAETLHRRQFKNAPYNPRSISPRQRGKLRRTIEKFKLVETLVWNRRTGNLVGGHQRISVLDELEGTEDYMLTVSVVDVDDATERALNIALNNPELTGQYDMDLLGQVIEGLMNESPSLVQDAGLDKSTLSQYFGDAFLTGEAADQAAVEAPIVAELNAMYETGAAAEKARNAAKERMAANAANQGQPADAPSPAPAPAGPAQPEPKYDFAGRRKEFNSERKTLDEADVYLALTFDSAEQLAAFRHYIGLDPMLRAMDATSLFNAVGIDVNEMIESYKAAESEGQFSVTGGGEVE